VADAELGEQCVNRADLNAGKSAAITQVRRTNTVIAIRNNERQRCEPCNDVSVSAGPSEALQEFLQHEPGGHDGFCAAKRGS
jgi:hypothetical protein